MQGGDKKVAAPEPGGAKAGAISRREFLKIAGSTGFAAALGGVLAACDTTSEGANTTATILAGQTTTSTTESMGTTVTSGPEAGREIRLGLVSAMTGPLALFGKADEWWTEFALEALPEGVLCGDRKLHKVVFATADSRSDPDRAARVAGELISGGKVDMIMCSGDARVVNPVADQAESLACPCLCSFVQWRPFSLGRGATPDKPFRWTYAHAVGLEDLAANYLAMWEQLPTNRKIGFIFGADAAGAVWADPETGLPAAITAAGYEYVLPAPDPAAIRDYSTHISEFLKNGCEIFCGAMSTADFIAFWKQSLELGYNPKIATVGEGLVFPQALEALGSDALNLTAESLWQPGWPYRDSITGKTCQELADDYQVQTGEQWVAPIAQYAKFEWAVDALRRVKYVDSKDAIIAQIRTTKLQTCLGPLDFTAPVDMDDLGKSKRPVDNVYKAPVGGAQWVRGDSFPFGQRLVSRVNSPALPVDGRVEPIAYRADS